MEQSSIIFDYNNESEGKNTKEILSSLLKKMLDHKLIKLEKKHNEESNSLRIMSKISQNIIISLENYSHKVRKEIYKRRHKNDLSRPKRRDKKYYDSNKSMYKEDKNNTSSDNNIESLINKETKTIVENSNHVYQKRNSKSIDPKKDKSFFSETSRNLKSAKKEKDKRDVFARLTSKSIGNFKKNKLTINTNSNTSHILSSKSKMKKCNNSSKNLPNVLNKRNDGAKNREQSPIDGKNSKLNSKPMTTNRSKKKRLTQYTFENVNKTTIISDSSKHLIKLKKMNSKGKLHRKSSKASMGTKKEKKNIDNNSKISDAKNKDDISSEINDANNSNKNTEVIENTILQKKTKSKELFPANVTRSIKEKLLIDDEVIKNVNKDELLVSALKDDDDGIAEISGLNLEGLDIKGSINLNINLENDSLLKKPGLDNNNSRTSALNNNSNNDQPINNIKTYTSIEKNIQNDSNNKISKNNDGSDNIESKSDKKINNIIITNQKNTPVNYLDNNEDIDFTLIDNSHVDENDNDNDGNKTIDLNISGLSDQLSLGEKFEAHLDEISRFLDMKDLCNLMLVNKECFTTIMNVLISKTEITIDILEEEINKLKEANKDIDFNKISISPFQFNSNSSRAVNLLNKTSECNLIKFSRGQNINNEIFRVFGIFFIAAGKKKQYLRLSNEEEKINYINKFFKKDIDNESLGFLINKEINGKIFDNDIISSLYKYSYKYIPIISPNRFQKTNKDVAIFVFVVKNILDHIGVLDQQNIKPDKEYILYNARLINNKIILDELNRFFEKIS